MMAIGYIATHNLRCDRSYGHTNYFMAVLYVAMDTCLVAINCFAALYNCDNNAMQRPRFFAFFWNGTCISQSIL